MTTSAKATKATTTPTITMQKSRSLTREEVLRNKRINDLKQTLRQYTSNYDNQSEKSRDKLDQQKYSSYEELNTQYDSVLEPAILDTSMRLDASEKIASYKEKSKQRKTSSRMGIAFVTVIVSCAIFVRMCQTTLASPSTSFFRESTNTLHPNANENNQQSQPEQQHKRSLPSRKGDSSQNNHYPGNSETGSSATHPSIPQRDDINNNDNNAQLSRHSRSRRWSNQENLPSTYGDYFDLCTESTYLTYIECVSLTLQQVFFVQPDQSLLSTREKNMFGHTMTTVDQNSNSDLSTTRKTKIQRALVSWPSEFVTPLEIDEPHTTPGSNYLIHEDSVTSLTKEMKRIVATSLTRKFYVYSRFQYCSGKTNKSFQMYIDDDTGEYIYLDTAYNHVLYTFPLPLVIEIYDCSL